MRDQNDAPEARPDAKDGDSRRQEAFDRQQSAERVLKVLAILREVSRNLSRGILQLPRPLRGQGALEKAAQNRERDLTSESQLETKADRHSEARFDRATDFIPNSGEQELRQQKKAEILEHSITEHNPVSPEKRLDQAKDFHYLQDQGFERELHHRDPGSTEQDRKLTEGFHDPRDNQAFVRDLPDGVFNARQGYQVGLHEKLHQKSLSDLPTRLNEGVTEYFARQQAGPEIRPFTSEEKELAAQHISDYENEVGIVSKLTATVGEKPFQEAYFNGNTKALKDHIDHHLGDGSYEKICSYLEDRQYNKASEIIEEYYKK